MPNVAITVIGLVCIWIAVRISRPSLITGSPTKPNLTVGATRWEDVRLYQNSDTRLTLLLGFGTALVSVVAIKFLENAMSQALRRKKSKKFVRFFGAGSLSKNERGHIILQADDIGTLMQDLTGKDSPTDLAIKDALELPTNNRLFKARQWVNARDAKSAKIVRDELRRQEFPTPEMYIIGRGNSSDPFREHTSAPYIISMGLAFTDTTKSTAKAVNPNEFCFYIKPDTERGDAIVVNGNYISKTDEDFETSKPIVIGKREFFELFPCGWKIQDWKDGKKDLKDYAVIIRHTATVPDPAGISPRKQVRFVLAGFTEDSTVAAGRYLANRWEMLHDRYVSIEGGGDFVAVIPGKAQSEHTWPSDPRVVFVGRQLGS